MTANMLPEAISSSYLQYKADTNAFVAWLQTSANSCRYTTTPLKIEAVNEPVAFGSSPRIKGRARKDARTTAAQVAKNKLKKGNVCPNYLLSSKDLLIQAKIIADNKHPKITVPCTIQKLLGDAIRARKRCASWFKNVQSPKSKVSLDYEKSNASHDHFISVLEKVWDILQPRFEASKPSQGHLAPQESPTRSLQNRFVGLNIEETDPGADKIMPSVPPISNVSKPTPDDVPCELELATEAELPFMIYCFFEDLHHIQNFLKEIWMNVETGSLSYMSASLTTNIALELVEKEEEKIIAFYPNRFTGAMYRSITSLVHHVPTFPSLDSEETLRYTCQHKANLEDRKLQENNLLGDSEFVYLQTFLSLEKYRTQLMYGKEDSYLGIFPCEMFWCLSDQLRPAAEAFDRAITEDSLLTHIIMDLDINAGSEIAARQVEEARRRGLLQKLTEDHVKFKPVEDKMTEKLRPFRLFYGRGITVSAVFTARILLDINNILDENITQPYRELRKLGAMANEMLGLKWSREEKYLRSPIPGLITTTQQLDKNWVHREIVEQAIMLSGCTVRVIKESKMVGIKHTFMTQFSNIQGLSEFPSFIAAIVEKTGVRCEDIGPNKDLAFYYNHAPVYSGMEAFKLALGMEKAGIDLSNAVCSVVCAAHLYKAIELEGLLQGCWSLMDQAITTHMSELFQGSLPTTADLVFRRFAMTMGVSIESFARNRRATNGCLSAASKRKIEKVFTIPKASTLLYQYFTLKISSEKLIYDMPKSKPKCQDGTQHPREPSFPLLQTLRDFHRSLEEKAPPALRSNLIPLARQCDELMLQIREAFKAKLNIEHMNNGHDCAEFYKSINATTVIDIFTDAFPPVTARRKKNRKGKSSSDVADVADMLHNTNQTLGLIQIAAEVMERFIQKAKEVVDVPPFDVVAEAVAISSIAPSQRRKRELDRIFSF